MKSAPFYIQYTKKKLIREFSNSIASNGHYHNSGPNVTVVPWNTGNTITSTAKWRPIRNF